MKYDEIRALKDAVVLLEKGWTQGAYRKMLNGKDCYCLSGAVLFAAGNTGLSINAWGLVHNLSTWIRTKQGTPAGTPPTVYFNDTPGRTQEEVIAILKEFITAKEAEVVTK